ncbi:hypothetical protein KSP39_PZI017606 [Platanthera zijinensis]|uniref:RRM domain-containing protein n=1 Tax=Platanthera zijinensis TaxID=2320716 RepID=A0AAP0FZI2_9ASPA
MMTSFSTYLHRDAPLPPAQPAQHPPPPISDAKEAPEGTVATLLVRHLPEGIPGDMLSRLFSHYGAASVRPCAGGKLRNCAFVDFKEEALASQAHLQLNRLRFLGKVITVDRADKSVSKNINPQSAGLSLKDASGTPVRASKESSVCPKNMESGGQPIAPRLGVDYPFPPHLEYAYPLPDGNILTNIVNALIAVPHFYTQVLHLMNKMNLPAPFRMALPTPPLPPPVPAPPPPPPPVTPKLQPADPSSSESELESSEEDTNDGHAHKRVKRENIVGPAIDKGVEHEAVGLKPAALVPKEFPLIKKKNPMLQIKLTAKPAQKDTDEDNYATGNPSTVLYIKNLAKDSNYRLDLKELNKGDEDPVCIWSLPRLKSWTDGNSALVLGIGYEAAAVMVSDIVFIFLSFLFSIYSLKVYISVKRSLWLYPLGCIFKLPRGYIEIFQRHYMRGEGYDISPCVTHSHSALATTAGKTVWSGPSKIVRLGRDAMGFVPDYYYLTVLLYCLCYYSMIFVGTLGGSSSLLPAIITRRMLASSFRSFDLPCDSLARSARCRDFAPTRLRRPPS